MNTVKHIFVLVFFIGILFSFVQYIPSFENGITKTEFCKKLNGENENGDDSEGSEDGSENADMDSDVDTDDFISAENKINWALVLNPLKFQILRSHYSNAIITKQSPPPRI